MMLADLSFFKNLRIPSSMSAGLKNTLYINTSRQAVCINSGAKATTKALPRA